MAENNENQPIDEIPVATAIAGAKILGLDNVGETKLFNINDIKGDYKGLAIASTNPGTPVLAQVYDAKPGVTYPNFKDANNAAITIPAEVDGKPVLTAKLIFNGTNWTADYVGTEVELADYAKKDKIGIETVNANIFNTNNASAGYIGYGDGVFVPLANYTSTDFIKIKPSTFYTMSFANQLAFYDADFNYISGDVGTSKSFTTPINAVYYRVGIPDSQLNAFFIIEGAEKFALLKGKYGFEGSGVKAENVSGIDLLGLSTNLKGKNLFDKTKKLDGYYVSATGELVLVGGDYYVAYPIRIVGGATYEFGDVNGQQYAFFDKNGFFIEGYAAITLGSESKTITAPHNAEYIMFTSVLSVIDQQYLIERKYISKFDKFTQLNNTYIGYGDGIATTASGYIATGFLPIKPNTKYEFGSIGSQQFAFYDINKNYISGYAGGVSGPNLKTITTPKGADYIRFTTQDGLEDSQYFVELPEHENIEIIKITAVQNANNWNSIRDLAIICKQDASRFKKYEILVPNGTWNECDWGNFGEFVSIKGQDRYLTIINCDGTDTNVNHVVPGDYVGSGAYAGLQFAAVPKDWRHLVFMVSDLNVSNMTFRAKSCKYVAHIDSDTKFKNVLFDNISFDEDDCNTPIGMGVWGGNNILFKYCSIKRALQGGLGVLFHNWVDQSDDTKTEFYGCSFKNCGYFDVQELGSQKNDYLIFNSCKTDVLDTSRYIVSSSSSYTPKSNTPYSIHVIVVNTPGVDIVSSADRPLYLARNEF